MSSLFYSVLEEGEDGLAHQSSDATPTSTSSSREYRERQEKLLEAQRKAKEERKKIAEQVRLGAVGHENSNQVLATPPDVD